MSNLQEDFEKLYPRIFTRDNLIIPTAFAMAAMLDSEQYGGAKLIACRDGNLAHPSAVLLIADFEVSLGQRQVENDIGPSERIGLVYPSADTLPVVFPLREGFPTSVPHLNVAMRGEPRSLCLFDMPEEEVLRFVTPFILSERIRLWLRETAYGRLHGDEQPLDPVFFGSARPVVLPPEEPTGQQSDLFYAFTRSDNEESPVFICPSNLREVAAHSRVGMLAVVITTKALPHTQLRWVPLNLAELLEEYQEMGTDILTDLQTAMRTWQSKSDLSKLMEQRCLLVILTPIERSPGNIGSVSAKAFLTHCKSGIVAEKLGAFYTIEGFSGQLISPPSIDSEALRVMKLMPMDVHRPFDRQLAQAASGTIGASGAATDVVLVGAGAVGSQVALTAARMGLGTWTVVDGDYLMPHNLARHGLSHSYVGLPKAEAVGREIHGLLGKKAAKWLIGKVEDTGLTGDALTSAALVIDASASVPTARWLSIASRHGGRTCSVFLNPLGTDLVMLIEGKHRTPRLDHVEMSYYWALANGECPANHLSDGKVGIFPSGGCRRVSLSISQADVGALAPLAARRLLQYPLPDEGFVEIRSLRVEAADAFSSTAATYKEVQLGEWTIAVSEELLTDLAADRREAGEFETGGIVVGIWDRIRKRVYVVGHYDPPPDSISDRTGFVRGMVGVHQMLETVQRHTAGNLTYIGEWHTHPSGYRSEPSADDEVLLEWIGDVLIFSDVPALMLIVGDDGIRALLGCSGESTLLAS